eukprot:CAMPEP_0168314040 /NCGR_PEP_ID=MMETSP0210-20121227/5960_1 /TAXON_ID=40633 /ORGANISM="Condylostoma magnum, Strain COL2" /LENGTH=46 /DNA_ID= /DNA_START= /DNA_END= /DNA_ORIENTATION=
MGDTYDRVQNSIISTDFKEKVQMILEVEVVMYWNRSKGEPLYLKKA